MLSLVSKWKFTEFPRLRLTLFFLSRFVLTSCEFFL